MPSGERPLPGYLVRTPRMRSLVWFRGKDVRMADHAPLADACARGEVLPLFVLDPFFFAPERARTTPYRIQFLLEALEDLDASLRRRGSRLLLAAGKSVEVVPQLARKWRVDRVVAQGWCAPFGRERDRRVRDALHVPFELMPGETLHELGSLRSSSGQPFRAFGPFLRAFERSVQPEQPLPPPTLVPRLPPGVTSPVGALPKLAELGIAANPRVLPGGESAASARLARFLHGGGPRYDGERDRLDLAATSRLSADLKFGTLSPQTVWHAATRALSEHAPALRSFQNELVWREFNHALLWEHPAVMREPFRPEWRNFPWRHSERDWHAWSEGVTGYPIVDAAARQLLAEGFVPNRARMISASFLTKHLLLDYRLGEAHYLRLLTDGDWAQNNANWQWCAGSGADAQPYFRVFNPILQAQKFDPHGDYVRRWVPELSGLEARFIHTPWLAPGASLARAHLALGRDYPEPCVDHSLARQRFLDTARAHLGKRRAKRP